jgi:choline-sulfatase
MNGAGVVRREAGGGRRLWLGLGLAVVAAGAVVAVRAARSQPPVRSVLLVTIDTLRADRVGAFGGPAGVTPNLDELARAGAVFENAFTAAPLTLPAHATLLTGVWPFRHGARVNGADAVDPSAPLVAERFRKAGFSTGAVVGSLVLRGETGLARGFDEYDDRFAENRGKPARAWNARRSGEEVVAHASAWLDAHEKERFFLWVHLYDPHAPYAAPAELAARFPGDPYSAAVAHADACLGALLARLRRGPAAGRTAVVVAADHGESLGEHGESTHGVFLYDATLRVPLVVASPRGTARRVASSVSLADVAPTLAELARLPEAGGPLDGLSLVPSLAGAASAARPHDVYAESVYPASLLGWSPLFAVRTATAKYVEAPRPELYRFPQDARERTNVFSAADEETRGLARALARIRGNGARASSKPASASGDALDLASLGYLTPTRGSAGLDLESAAFRPDPKDRIAEWDAMERAVIARQSGKLDEAIALLENGPAASRQPSDAAVLRELALCLRRSRRTERALAVYEKLVGSPDAVAEDWFGLGVAWHLAGKDDRALEAHEEAVRRDPRHVDAWLDLGHERLALGRFEPARTAFERALALDSGGADALAGLAAVAFERRDWDTAEARLREALTRAPGDRRLLENLERVESARARDRGGERKPESTAVLRSPAAGG